MTGQGTSLPATPSQRGHMRQKWQKDRGNQRGTRARRTTRGPERADRGGSRGARAEGARGEPGPRRSRGARANRTAPRKTAPGRRTRVNQSLRRTRTARTAPRNRGLRRTTTRKATWGRSWREQPWAGNAGYHSRAPTTREQPLTGTDNAQEARVQTTHEIRTRVSSSVAHIVHSWNRRVPGGTHARLAARGTNREAVRVGDQRASPVRPDLSNNSSRALATHHPPTAHLGTPGPRERAAVPAPSPHDAARETSANAGPRAAGDGKGRRVGNPGPEDSVA